MDFNSVSEPRDRILVCWVSQLGYNNATRMKGGDNS